MRFLNTAERVVLHMVGVYPPSAVISHDRSM
jgi:hypothetical protein